MTERWFKLWIVTPSGLRMYYMPLERFAGIFNTLIQENDTCDIVVDVMKLPRLPDIPVTWTAHPEPTKKGSWTLDH